MSESGPQEVQAQVSLPSYYRLVRDNSNFRRLWTAQVVSELGDWFYSVAVYDLVFRLTGSAQSVGVVVLLQILPLFFMGPTAGAVNDRVSRKAVMIAADLCRALIVLGLVAVQRRDQLWLLYVLLAAESISATFFEPGRTAVIPNIVKQEEVIAANALSSATWSVAMAVGAGLGGVVVHLLGRTSAFVINSLSFLTSAALIVQMRFTEPHLGAGRRLKWIDILGFGPIIEGIRYVKGDLRLASTLFVKFGLGLQGANWVLLPVMGEREFHVAGAGVLGMSTLLMFGGVGALIGPLIGVQFAGPSQPCMRRGVLVGFLAVGVFLALLGRAPTLSLASACVVGGWAAGSIIWVFSTTLLQLNTNDEFRGRVFAADMGLNVLSAAASAYTLGFAVDHGIAPRTAALVLGSVMLLPGAAWALALRLWRSAK